MQFPYQIQLLFVFWALYCYGNFSLSAGVESNKRRRPECVFCCLHFLLMLYCFMLTIHLFKHYVTWFIGKKQRKRRFSGGNKSGQRELNKGVSWWDLVASLSPARSTLHCWKQVRGCCFADFLRVCVTLFQETVGGQWHSPCMCCVTLGANPLSRSSLEMSFDILPLSF